MTSGAAADDPNLAQLGVVATVLGELCASLVFVGGCATGLLVTAARAQRIRVTADVDLVAEITTAHAYHRMEAALQARGLIHDLSPAAPICRWVYKGVTVDLMPSEPGVLGFHNRWYPLAVETAREIALPSGQPIRLIHAPLFIATKLEAFKGRGNAGYLMSHDLEDIMTVVDGRVELIEETRSMPKDLLRYLSDEFTQLINAPAFMEALPGHLPGDIASQQRLPELLNRLRALSRLAR